MSPERWARVAYLFEEALDLPAHEQAAFAASIESPEDRTEVDKLLAQQTGDGLLNRVLGSGSGVRLTPPTPRLASGAQIGPYRVEREIGRGGAGTVYAATDVRAEKLVALKVLPPPGEDGRAHRHLREARLLGRFDHPNVARYQGAGVAQTPHDDANVAFVAMDLVKGGPVTLFADAEGLDARERVLLLIQASDAVQHALGKGVLHRDVKPSNVLAGRDEHGTPRAVVVDFGVGKLLEPEADAGRSPEASTPPTSFRLTPSYAAPEQLRGEPSTAATDVYGLGLLGYELLTSAQAFDTHRLGFREAAERMAAHPPALPSMAAPTSRASALKGDLDAIVLRALAHDPTERYESAGDLRDDLRRHLAHEVVSARGRAPVYVAGKFLRRRWPWFVAAVAVLGLGSVALFSVVEARARATDATSGRAAMVKLYTQVFEGGDVWQTGDADPALGAYLSAVALRVNQLRLSPRDESDLRGMLGRTATTLALFDLAEDQIERALVLADSDPVRHANRLVDLAALRTRQGDYFAAESLSAVAAVAFGDHDDRFLALQQGGVALAHLGDTQAADSLYRKALRLCEDSRGARAPDCTKLLLNRAAAAAMLSEYERADSLYLQVLGLLHERYRETAPTLWQAEANHANVLASLGRHEEAIDVLRRVRSVGAAQFGDGHPEVEKVANDLAATHLRAGFADVAAEIFAEALDRRRDLLGPDHPDVAFSANNLAVAYARQGQYASALELYREVLRILVLAVGPDHPNVAVLRDNVGASLRDLGRFEEAEAELGRALLQRRDLFGDDHLQVAASLYNLGLLDSRRQRYGEAAGRLRQSLRIRERDLGDDHPLVATTRLELGDALSFLGQRPEARQLIEAGLQSRRNAFPLSEAGVAHGELLLALVDEDRDASREAVDRLSESHGIDHPMVQRLRSRLR